MRLRNATVGSYLAGLGVMPQGVDLRVEAAGDGNINYVRRVTDGTRSVVVKQARGELERFPEYSVTTERIVFEHRYAEIVAERAPRERELLPDVLHFDATHRVLVLEDLGTGPLLADRLADGSVAAATLHRLGVFLGRVHAATRGIAERLAPRFSNESMRALHGEHIFSLPYEADAFKVDLPIRAAADTMLAQPGIRDAIAALRTRYYETADALLHGDVQSGNVVLQGDRPRLIDAEIAHVGDPAFDVGTAIAHVVAWDPAAGGALGRGYLEGGGTPGDLERAHRYAGVELLRRTLGAARIPDLTESGNPAAAERVLQRGFALLTQGSNALTGAT